MVRMTSANKEEFGVCDDCGEYTEELILIEGSWVCKTCSHMI